MKRHPSNKGMRIPEPTVTEEGEVEYWPIVKVGRVEPFGYRVDPEDKNVLLPVPHELDLLKQAKAHLKQGFSLRDVSAWLSNESGRYISHEGLKHRVNADIERGKEYANCRHIAKQLASVYKKAKLIECSRLGKSAPLDHDLKQEILEIVGETSSD
jgi:hypothetical protein